MANSPFLRAGEARACQDGELDQATRPTRHFVVLAILASMITQAIMLAILASRTSPTCHFGKVGPVLLAILVSWTSPTRHFENPGPQGKLGFLDFPPITEIDGVNFGSHSLALEGSVDQLSNMMRMKLSLLSNNPRASSSYKAQLSEHIVQLSKQANQTKRQGQLAILASWTSPGLPGWRVRPSNKTNSQFWITEAILLAILESRITQAILLAILASRTSPTRHFGKKGRTSNRARHFGPVLLAILASMITQAILLAILATRTSPTRHFGKYDHTINPDRHFGELDQSYSSKWRVGSSTPSNSPARRIGPNLMPSVEPRRVNPSFRLDRSYHRSLTIRTAKICIPD
ncbi:hypothetical protein F2Q69_00053460 [Brassica cretica]|uniref:Uncharacterized protein n=1 Tax=Brassica cretica TaxID=69181 RepID=A0A8S9N5L9_BRACR|nr:hypothetical protein F2Q69_00053460 [Brassica cretica]